MLNIGPFLVESHQLLPQLGLWDPCISSSVGSSGVSAQIFVIGNRDSSVTLLHNGAPYGHFNYKSAQNSPSSGHLRFISLSVIGVKPAHIALEGSNAWENKRHC